MFTRRQYTKLRSRQSLGIPIFLDKTEGEREELVDLKRAIKNAKEKFGFDTLVTVVLHSVYQAERIQKICDDFWF